MQPAYHLNVFKNITQPEFVFVLVLVVCPLILNSLIEYEMLRRLEYRTDLFYKYRLIKN